MSDKVNKKIFKVTVDGKEVEVAVLRPDRKAQDAAQLAYNRAFRLAVKPEDGKAGAIVRGALEGVLREQGIWDDARQKELEKLNKALLDGEKKLARGGIRLSAARDVAIQMRRDRWALRRLLAKRNELDAMTAEAQAENARFNALVASCTREGGSGKPWWKNEDAYLSANDDDDVARQAAGFLANMVYDVEDDFESKLPENSWLRAQKLVDKEGHLVDRKGRLIDAEGRLVDKEGRLVSEKGELIDTEGNLLAEDGSYKVETLPFLDDDDKPIDTVVVVDVCTTVEAPPEVEKAVAA